MNNDYFMRQIEQIMQFITATFFKKDTQEIPMFDSTGQPLESGFLHITILTLIKQGEINRAENLLFEKVEQYPCEEYLMVALDFYSRLNELSDEALASGEFSRQEIIDGLNEIKSICEEM